MARKSNLPLHSNQGRAWDGPAAAGRMLDAATNSDGSINSSVASEGFTYMLEDGSQRGHYKSPFADIINGTKQVVKRGVNAALSRNSSVQGISEDERSSGETFLKGQQARFPNESGGDEERKRQLRQTLAQGIKFQTEPTDREDGRILVASGTTSRNRDYYTGKPYRLVPAGMRYGAWAKTGLVLYMHNFNIPLGRSRMYLEDGKLWAPDSIDFHRQIVPVATQNWIGDAVGDFNTAVIADLWEQGYLNSVSIHVMFTLEDEENVVELEDEILIPTSEVIEFSVVTIPGDREANREKFLSMGLNPALVECLVCESGERSDGLVVPHKGGLVKPGDIVMAGDTGKEVFIPAGRSAKNNSPEETVMEPEEQDVEEVTEVEEPETEAAEVEDNDVEETFIAVEMDFGPEEDGFAIDTLEFAQALAEDQEALLVLARAFAADPVVLSTFAQAFQANAEHILQPQSLQPLVAAPLRLRFVNSRRQKPEVTAQAAQPAPKKKPNRRETLAELQTPPEPKIPARSAARRQRVLGLVRS